MAGFAVPARSATVTDGRKGNTFEATSRQRGARLRLIHGIGTEGNLPMRSLQRAQAQDGNGRGAVQLDLGRAAS